MKAFFLMMAVVVVGLFPTPLYSMNTEEISIKVLEAHPNGIVKVEVSNKASQSLRIWAQDNSWGWSNWSFEFFDQNQLIVYVRKPDEGFTVNVPHYLTIADSGTQSISFDLNDGTWVSHRLPMWPAYPSREDKENAIKGCFAVIAIPHSTQSKTLGIWTGVATSPFH